MTFIEWLETATKKDGSKLSKRTIEHYYSGFKIYQKKCLKMVLLTSF